MRLLQGPTLVEALPSDLWEDGVIREILRIRDPNRKKSYEFRQGSWDGFHEFMFSGPTGDMILFPVGLLPWVRVRLKKADVPFEVENTSELDEVLAGLPEGLNADAVVPDLVEGATLRDYQVLAVRKALLLRRGVVYAPPRSGKTLMQLAMVKLFASFDLPTVLLVHRVKLARQTARVAKRLGIPLQIIDGTSCFVQSEHVVATVQTVRRGLRRTNDGIVDLLQRAKLLQGDEIHSLSDSEQWVSSALGCNAPYRIGYSGTPFHKEDGWNHRDFWLRGCFGPLIFKITPDYLMDRGYLVSADIFAVKVGSPERMMGWNSWGSVYKTGIVENPYSNQTILRLAKECVSAGRKVLILVAQLAHGELLLRGLKARGIDTVFAAGGDRSVRLDESNELEPMSISDEDLLDSFQRGETGGVLLGSTVYDQGIDLPFVDTVILAGGWKSAILAIQRAYRCLTPSDGKVRGLIIDMAHHFNWILRAHSEARRRHLQVSVNRDREIRVIPLIQALKKIRGA